MLVQLVQPVLLVLKNQFKSVLLNKDKTFFKLGNTGPTGDKGQQGDAGWLKYIF